MKKNEDGTILFDNQDDLDAIIKERLKRQEDSIASKKEKEIESKYQKQVAEYMEKIEDFNKQLASSPSPEEFAKLTEEKNQYYEKMVGAEKMREKIEKEKLAAEQELTEKLRKENEKFRLEKAMNVVGEAYNATTLDKKFQRFIVREVLDAVAFDEEGKILIKVGEEQKDPAEFLNKYAEEHPEFCTNGKPTPVPSVGQTGRIHYDDPRVELDHVTSDIKQEILSKGIPAPTNAGPKDK